MEKTNEMQATAERYSMIVFMGDRAGLNYEFELQLDDKEVTTGEAKYLSLKDKFGLDPYMFDWEWNHYEPDPNGANISWMATVYLDEKTYNKVLMAYTK